MMSTAKNLVVSVLVAGGIGLALGAPPAAAQSAPDLRNLRPHLMLLIDSSGSMERLPGCTCTSASCNECLPDCGAAEEKNRWATLLEALNGSYDTFACTEQGRGVYSGQYDHNYFIPHHIPAGTQQSNGVLDVYVDRLRFGLMTFDGISTLTTGGTLVASTSWDAGYQSSSNGAAGMYSYGGHHPFTFPGCLTTYAIDNGARGDEAGASLGGPAPAIPGNLISFGQETDNHVPINTRIQASLQELRPFGATPIAGMLDDYRYFIANDDDARPFTGTVGVGDPYAQCRNRFAVLVTDGYPNADMRGEPYNCDAPGFTCPYERPDEIVSDLCDYDSAAGQCTGDVDGVFVVGFNVADAAAVTLLDNLAAVGGTGTAFFADDRDTLVAALSAAFDAAAPGATTRTVPAFTSGSAGTNGAQYQFNTGFNVGGVTGADPWNGVLERRRFTCSGVSVVDEPVDDTENDRFHIVLNNRVAPRVLYSAPPPVVTSCSDSYSPACCTAGSCAGGCFATCGFVTECIVTSTCSPATVPSWITGEGAGEIAPALVPPTTLGTPEDEDVVTSVMETTNPALTQDHVDPTSVRPLAEVLDWVHGRATADPLRIANRLGDIYHSSPAVVAAPTVDRADEAFNLFRQTNIVMSRPTVVYVGSNDGILHAFAAEDHTVVCDGTGACPHDGDTIDAGTELWGFTPPMLLGKIKDAMVSHQWMVDGNIVVRDMFYARLPGEIPDAAQYRTILLGSLRQGGPAVFALDVTDPLAAPKFLWQFTQPDMGETFGAPALAQVLLTVGAAVHERGIAIIPGGANSGAPNPCAAPLADASDRPTRLCWPGTTGRSLYVIDLATGYILRKWDDTLLTAPMTGGVSVFTGETGTIATRAFMSDASGMIWRLNLAAKDAADWELEPFHDVYYDEVDPLLAEPAYNPPILTTNLSGEVVVIQATGNIDLLDDATSMNRVVSVTEELDFTVDINDPVVTKTVNWTIELPVSEQVTGPLELFDGGVYFGTFKAITSATDYCEFGESRLWGVDYLGTAGAPTPGKLETFTGSGIFVTDLGPFANQLIMGVAATQRPTCFTGETYTDPYLGNRYRVTGQGGGEFRLVAQVGGSGSLATGATIAEIERPLPVPMSVTRVEAFGGAIE